MKIEENENSSSTPTKVTPQPAKCLLSGPVEEFRAAGGDATLVHFGTNTAGGVSQSTGHPGNGGMGKMAWHFVSF